MMEARRTEVVFILLSYKRPWNIGCLLSPIRSLDLPKRIIISNNNPDIDLIPFLPPEADDIELVQQPQHCLAIKRFELARNISAKCFVCIDDDIFLTQAQLMGLLEAYTCNPHIPQGVCGQVLLERDGTMVLKGGFRNLARKVDILNRVYVFSSEHVMRFFQLLSLLGFDEAEELGHADDIVLSFCGNGAPLIHDLGPYESCVTDSEPGIALWKEEGFTEHRMEIFERLRRLTGIN